MGTDTYFGNIGGGTERIKRLDNYTRKRKCDQLEQMNQLTKDQFRGSERKRQFKKAVSAMNSWFQDR